jgi:5-methylcytosine-specific restriction endonuclease McrA
LRSKLIKLCKRICALCLKRHRKSELILDHRIPIALGGAEFDESNLQIICIACNREKNRQDQARIAEARRKRRPQTEPDVATGLAVGNRNDALTRLSPELSPNATGSHG